MGHNSRGSSPVPRAPLTVSVTVILPMISCRRVKTQAIRLPEGGSQKVINRSFIKVQCQEHQALEGLAYLALGPRGFPVNLRVKFSVRVSKSSIL